MGFIVENFGSSFVNLLITSFAYLIVPACYAFLTQTPSDKWRRFVTITNAIVIYFIFITLGGGNFVACLLWSSIGNFIARKIIKSRADKWTAFYDEYCTTCDHCGEVYLLTEAKCPKCGYVNKPKPSTQNISEKVVCRSCKKAFDADMASCPYCGVPQQYVNPSPAVERPSPPDTFYGAGARNRRRDKMNKLTLSAIILFGIAFILSILLAVCYFVPESPQTLSQNSSIPNSPIPSPTDSPIHLKTTPTPTATPNRDAYSKKESPPSDGFISDVPVNTMSPEQAAKQRLMNKVKPKVVYENGQIITYPADEQICPLSVTASDYCSFYIFLKSNSLSKNNMSFMVKKGMTAEVLVPIGMYEIYWATGDNWYGKQLHFGTDTRYYVADDVFRFYTDDAHSYGYTLELYDQINGNLEEEPISAAEFPG